MKKNTAVESMLFEPGAPPVNGFIPLCIPEIRGREWQYLKECLDTNFVSSVGPFVDRFELGLAGYVGARHAVATSSGTAALHIALLVSGVQPDDEVLVSTLTFIAPVNTIRYVGAWPVFIDAEPEYWQMDPQRVVEFLERECRVRNGGLQNKRTGRRVRGILPVHILGHPVDLDPIVRAARKYDLVVIEDATESLGAKYRGRPVGTLGDIACFSFNGNKIITTGGGGMIVTNDRTWAQKAKYLTTQAKDDPVEFVHNEIGYNYRLSNIQAALGVAQLEVLDSYIDAKRRIAAYYDQALKAVPGIRLMKEASWAESIFWMYTILVDEEIFGVSSRGLLRKFSKEKIQTRPLWQPIHLSKIYRDRVKADCPTAEYLHGAALSLPCSVGLSREEQDKVLGVVGAGGKAQR